MDQKDNNGLKRVQNWTKEDLKMDQKEQKTGPKFRSAT